MRLEAIPVAPKTTGKLNNLGYSVWKTLSLQELSNALTDTAFPGRVYDAALAHDADIVVAQSAIRNRSSDLYRDHILPSTTQSMYRILTATRSKYLPSRGLFSRCFGMPTNPTAPVSILLEIFTSQATTFLMA